MSKQTPNSGSKLISLEALAGGEVDKDLFSLGGDEPIDPVLPPVDTTDDEPIILDPIIPDPVVPDPIVPDPIVEPDTTEEPESSKVYKKILLDTFGDVGIFETEDEEGNVVEHTLDSLILDEAQFTEILQQKLALEKELATKDKVSIKGVSDITKAMIEIDNNGGDSSSLLQVRQQYYDPIASIDMDDVAGQKHMLYLRMSSQGISESDISDLITTYEANGTLKTKAEQAEVQMKALLNKVVEEEKAKAREAAEKAAAADKAFRNSVKTIASNFELNEAFRKKVVDLATKKDDKNVYEIDKIYGEAMKDPEKAFKISLMLLDEEAYNKQITEQKIRDVKKDQLQRLRLTGRSGAQSLDKRNDKPNPGDRLIPLDKL